MISPSLGLLYTLVQARQPFTAPARTLIRGRLDAHVHPEVWDRAFNRDVQPWVRVVFTNGTAVQGIARFAGLSPAGRRLFLVPWTGVPESLMRLDADGNVPKDLTARAGEGIWVEISSEVLFVEIFG